MQNFEQNTKKKNTFELHLHCLNHVCKVNEKSLVDYFKHVLKVATQIIVCDCYIPKCKNFPPTGGF